MITTYIHVYNLGAIPYRYLFAVVNVLYFIYRRRHLYSSAHLFTSVIRAGRDVMMSSSSNQSQPNCDGYKLGIWAGINIIQQ